VAPPVFKTGLAGIAFAGRFDSFPPPPLISLGDIYKPVRIVNFFGAEKNCRPDRRASMKCRAMRLVSKNVKGVDSRGDYHSPSL
jgi:hypothetical protein